MTRATTLRETPAHRFAHIRRGDVPALWFPRRTWSEWALDWWHEAVTKFRRRQQA